MVFYVAYAVILTAFLLYIRFPTDKFRQYCASYLSNVFPGMEGSIVGIRYGFPGVVVFSGINFKSTATGNRSLLVVDNFKMSLQNGRFWRGLQLTGSMYSGSLSALLEFDIGSGQFKMQDIQAKGLDLEALLSNLQISDRKITGRISCSDGKYEATFKDPYGGTGQGKVTVGSGTFALLQPILSLSTLDFQQLAFEMKLEPARKIGIQGGKLQGSDLSIDFSGGLAGGDSLMESNLQLGGQLVLQNNFLANHPEEQKMVQGLVKHYNRPGIPFKVGGTVNRPTFRFGM